MRVVELDVECRGPRAVESLVRGHLAELERIYMENRLSEKEIDSR